MQKIVNPELTRNIWLNFSSSNALVMPFLIALIAFPIFLMFDNSIMALSITSFFVFYVVTVLFGMSSGSSGIQNEINNNTWDFQRMSSASAWQITFGKFLGGISYVWYLGFIALAIFIISTYVMGQDIKDIVYNSGFAKDNFIGKQLNKLKASSLEGIQIDLSLLQLIKFSAYIFITVIFGQAIVFFFSIPTGNERTEKISNRNIIGILITTWLISQIYSLQLQELLFDAGIANKVSTINWYDYKFNALSLTLSTILFFLFWALFGSYRVIRKKLQYKVTPIAWTIFAISTSFLIAGFDNIIGRNNGLNLLTVSYILLVFTYYSFCREVDDLNLVKRFIYNLRNKNKKQVFENMPMFIPTFIAISITLIFGLTYQLEETNSLNKLFLYFSILMFILRDFAFLYIISINNYFGKKGRLFYKNMLYLIVMYIAIPTVFHKFIEIKSVLLLSNKNIANSTDLLQGLFYPTINTLSATAGLLIALYLLNKTIKKHFKKET